MNFEKVEKYILRRMKSKLPRNLFYHKLEHSQDVLQATERIAATEKINNHDTILLRTAAILHDSGFLVEYKNNESLGCEIATNILHEYGYEKNDIQTICDMIMATAIPQKPKNKLEEILCDADMDYLGRDDFFQIAKEFRKELKVHGKEFSDREWLKFEIDFLEKHKYFTKTSQRLRDTQKQKHISKLKKKLCKTK